jgi:transposase
MLLIFILRFIEITKEKDPLMRQLIIPKIDRPVKRRLRRIIRKSKQVGQCRRALAIIHLSNNHTVLEVAEMIQAARSTIYRWISEFDERGEQSLIIQYGGHPICTVTTHVKRLMKKLIESVPHAYSYLRSTWTSEMIAVEIGRQIGVKIHSSTVRRQIKKLGYRWNRARPTLFKRDPRKREKLRAIYQAIKNVKSEEAVLFVDEGEVCFVPKIGFTWTKIGHQQAIPTPGVKNEKSFLAASLDNQTGQVLYAERPRNNSDLFIDLLDKIKTEYQSKLKVTLILDNYCTHKSKVTRQWLMDNEKFVLLFQPVYYPWCNRVERLWKTLHDTVTRNHRWGSFHTLMNVVRQFIKKVQPFPGAHQGLALLESGIA